MPPAALVGLIVAYHNSIDAGPVARTHFVYQIRTFWFGLLTLMVSMTLGLSYVAIIFTFMTAGEFAAPESVPPVLIVSGAVFLWWMVWTIVRCVKGLVIAIARQPMPNPKTLLW